MWFISCGAASFALVPSSLLHTQRGRDTHMAYTVAEPCNAEAGALLPHKRVTFIGAPFCEGQNLVGSDLAPLAIRHAGVQYAAEMMGWEWEDDGDLDLRRTLLLVASQRTASTGRPSSAIKRGWPRAGGTHSRFGAATMQRPKRRRPKSPKPWRCMMMRMLHLAPSRMRWSTAS